MNPLIVFLFGIFVGSFANVCIHRWPRNQTTRSPRRSYCPWCNKQISWFDNIPLASFLFLKGRCRSCESKISIRYFSVEILMGLMWVIFWLGLSGKDSFNYIFMFTAFYFGFVALVTTFIDLEWKIIPDQTTYPLLLLALATSMFNPFFTDVMPWERFFSSLLGATTGGGLLLFIATIGRWFFKKEAMGGGDIKLLAGIGALLGWEGTVYTLFTASVLGSLVSLLLISLKILRRREYIPFGPFLNVGAVGTFLWMVHRLPG